MGDYQPVRDAIDEIGLAIHTAIQDKDMTDIQQYVFCDYLDAEIAQIRRDLSDRHNAYKRDHPELRDGGY